MIDVHCHLNFHAFQKDTDEVINRAFKKGITKIINVGTQLDSSKHAIQLAEKYNNLYAIVGVHPHHADKLELAHDWIKQLETLAKHPKVVGIGECGMDYFRYQSNGIVDSKVQRDVFEAQIQLASRLKLPLQIHQRLAGNDVIEILEHHKNLLQVVPGMFHCMSGDIPFLKRVLDMGFYVGFDGNITYPGLAPKETVELKELVSYAPIDRIVAETDSPYLTPIPHRGSRNEPSYGIIVGKYIAQIKNIPFETVVDQTTRNVYTIFNRIKQ